MRNAADHRGRFYEIMLGLGERIGTHHLAECHGRMDWPTRGVYFFFQPGEHRADGCDRVVRIGTHAVSARSKTTLWKRLSQHRGVVKTGGGNHRGSIFRLHVGTSMLSRGDCVSPEGAAWGRGSTAPREVRTAEHPIEVAVSSYIGAMPFLWIEAEDEPGRTSVRAYIERNSVALLSRTTVNGSAADSPSPKWLGTHSDRDQVRASGLWNVNHTREEYDPAFLDVFARLADRTEPLL